MRDTKQLRCLTVAIACVVVTMGVVAAAAQKKAPAEPGFESLSLVLLMRGPNADEIAGDELQEIQSRHLAHLSRMREEGHMLIAGPFGDQNDPAFRGMCLYRVPVDEARRLAEADPAVKAGRLRVEVMTWWFHAGLMEFPNATAAAD